MRSEYQIDFLPTNNGSAVCLRYGVPGQYRVMVYDGGPLEAGERLVTHIREHFETNVVNDVVYAHPNAEHASGLSVVLDKMEVHELWMHRPWVHAAASCSGNGESGKVAAAAHFKKKMAAAYALEKMALARGIRLSEPFQGYRIGPFTVLSPSYGWYVQKLIPAFKMPRPKCPMPPNAMRLRRQTEIRIDDSTMLQLPESWTVETLREGEETSAENESSVVLFGLISGRGILLTGKAGIKALTAAADYAEDTWMLIPAYLRFAQIPHHGTRNHLSPSVLNRLFGHKLPDSNTVRPEAIAFVSTSGDDDKHPSKAVVNALIRRGAQVVPTNGKIKRHAWRFAQDEIWEPTDALPFLPGL